MRPDETARPDEERLLEAVDSCRPGSVDHQLPETAFLSELFERDHTSRELFNRVQQFDTSIDAAMHRAEVPPGLENRLLAALEAARAAPASELVQAAIEAAAPVIEAAAPVVEEAAPALVNKPRRRTSRRVWIASGVATAAALLVAYWFWPANEYTHEGVLAFGQEFFAADASHHGSGVSPSVKAPPKGYRLSRFVNPHAGPKWRYVKGFLGRNGVAYDLDLGGVKATLYVVKVAGTPKSPHILPGAGQAPIRHPASSGQNPTDAWIENGFMYVLVVDGSEDDYQQFISSGGAVA